MAKSTLSRRGKNRVAAVLSLSGLVLAACSAVSEQPAPVYTVRIVSTGIPTAASGPIMREMAAPVVLGPSLAPPTVMAHPASDVIPLDNPPPPPPAPARQPSEPVSVVAMPPPAAPAPMPAPAPIPTPAASPAILASPLPTLPPVAADVRAKPSVATQARAEPAPSPAREPITAAPAAADIASPGAFVKVKDDRARYRPRYYYSP